ncbi:hypothetical protein SAMN05443529_11277 [Desulfosporosinus hippei DSM 8344]|uniref:Uncharacterized protein n=1 Tax=Desulfosporosinus hippei DSM 8344 TaxID=1121419 RepID=A0A1G8BN80_9FIRM|nr:hypothetical protein SAMN05443529_11277 [Desulfosporosinus hippei DSM 8344]
MSAKRMRQWSRAKASADGSRPRSAPQVHMQKYPEVRTRSRTVQRASGGTRRRVQTSAPPQMQTEESTPSAQKTLIEVTLNEIQRISLRKTQHYRTAVRI